MIDNNLEDPWTVAGVLALAELEAAPHEAAEDPAPDEETSRFLWCLHCERAFHKNRRPACGYIGRRRGCWYRDCDGGTMDLWEWVQIRDAHGYPEAPRPHVLYPQFGPATIDPRDPAYPYAYQERAEEVTP